MADTHQGCVAIITGAGRGLGRTMALGLLQAGAQVTGVDIDPPALEELNGAAGAARQRLLPLKADVTREDEARGIVAQTIERFGRVDVLVNNAGLNLSTVDAGEDQDRAEHPRHRARRLPPHPRSQFDRSLSSSRAPRSSRC